MPQLCDGFTSFAAYSANLGLDCKEKVENLQEIESFYIKYNLDV